MPPKKINGINEKVVTRLLKGVVLEVSLPDHDTIIEIMKQNLNRHGRSLPEDVLQLIASSSMNSVSEIEGALSKLFIHADVYHEPINIADASRLLMINDKSEALKHKK